MSVFLYCYTYSLYIQEKNEQLYAISENLHQAVEQLFEQNKAFLPMQRQDPPLSHTGPKALPKAAVSPSSMSLQQANDQLNKISHPAGINFMVADEQCHILFKSSSQDNEPDLKPDVCEKISKNSVKSSNKFLFLAFDSEKDDYLYHRRLVNYPNIIIFTSFNKAILEKDLHRQFFPRVCELIFMGLFCIVVLYFFRRKIITPISILSQYAIKISKGEVDTKIPKQNSIELFNLAKALILVKHYIKRNEIYQKKIEEANEIVKTSAEAREDFVKSINQELMHPLKEILICTEILLKETLENNLEDHYSTNDHAIRLKCIEKIREAAISIKSKTSNSLNLSSFDFNTILYQAIQINLKPSFLKKITLRTSLSENMPPLYGDALKIKQILVCLISQSIENSTENQEILLSTNAITHNNQPHIQVIIKDFGFGLSEEELQRMQQNIGWIEENELFTNMEHSFIEKVMKLHNGTFMAENKIHEGRTVFLTFPIQKEQDYLFTQEKNNIYYLPFKKT
jgi:signal transduction histidine kinase